jgi:hypothetical protein
MLFRVTRLVGVPGAVGLVAAEAAVDKHAQLILGLARPRHLAWQNEAECQDGGTRMKRPRMLLYREGRKGRLLWWSKLLTQASMLVTPAAVSLCTR